MATIDKIYGSTKQYDEFYAWAKENKPKILKHFYQRDSYENPLSRPITNFSKEVDDWLLINCPIKFVIFAIKDQYNIL